MAIPKNTPTIRYFAFGAMVNPISRERRNVKAMNCRPAILKGFRMEFSLAGFGNVYPDPTAETHGVLMDFVNEEDWETIKDIESGYKTQEVTVYPYCGEPVLAHIFYADDQSKKNVLPQERYLNIIANGLEYHGVRDDYIDYIRSAECIKGRTPENYWTFKGDSDDLPIISYDEYEKRAKDEHLFLLGGLVIQILEPPCQESNDAMYKFLYNKAVGQPDLLNFMLVAIYDPDLPGPELHDKWAIDMMVSTFYAAGDYDKFQAVARVTKNEK